MEKNKPISENEKIQARKEEGNKIPDEKGSKKDNGQCCPTAESLNKMKP